MTDLNHEFAINDLKEYVGYLNKRMEHLYTLIREIQEKLDSHEFILTSRKI